jgi:predicted nucleic acid-binding protein
MAFWWPKGGGASPEPILRWPLDLLLNLPIVEVEMLAQAILQSIRELAHAQDLTVYDAAYLDLAMKRGLPLATLDEDLREAAQRTGVTLFNIP